jgi:methylation protein EvaC
MNSNLKSSPSPSLAECRICAGPISVVHAFGQMPIANGFLSEAEFGKEQRFDLTLVRCSRCGMAQLDKILNQSALFHDEYAFYSSTSNRMAAHFRDHAVNILAHVREKADPFVVELGSNDGILLRHIAAAGIRHLGVEPSENVAKVAEAIGVRSLPSFFSADLADQIRGTDGAADVIVAANVMCHIEHIRDVFDGIRILLAPDGLFIFEDPYLGEIIRKTAYDQIYDEHAYYFSLQSIEYLAALHGMEVSDVESLQVHGGSMRYTLSHKGVIAPAPAVAQLRVEEKEIKLDDPSTFFAFSRAVDKSRTDLIDAVKTAREMNKRIVGYGATSKSTTVINYCGLTPADIKFISDTTPIKQGKFSPGAHIPIRPYAEFQNDYPEIALLFAWNHAREIMENESGFEASGGQWLRYVPEVSLI